MTPIALLILYKEDIFRDTAVDLLAVVYEILSVARTAEVDT